MARRVGLDGRNSVEPVGPGDVLRPWQRDAEEVIGAESSWAVLEATWVAVLDEDFWRRLAPWPTITVAFHERLMDRVRSLSLRLAIVRNPSLSRRVHLMLWHLAGRYGRVRKGGVVHLPLRLSQEILAELVAAQRPSVSRALSQLEAEGAVVRTPDRTFVLRDPHDPGRRLL